MPACLPTLISTILVLARAERFTMNDGGSAAAPPHLFISLLPFIAINRPSAPAFFLSREFHLADDGLSVWDDADVLTPLVFRRLLSASSEQHAGSLEFRLMAALMCLFPRSRRPPGVMARGISGAGHFQKNCGLRLVGLSFKIGSQFPRPIAKSCPIETTD